MTEASRRCTAEQGLDLTASSASGRVVELVRATATETRLDVTEVVEDSRLFVW